MNNEKSLEEKLKKLNLLLQNCTDEQLDILKGILITCNFVNEKEEVGKVG